jgi:hypothetical protein
MQLNTTTASELCNRKLMCETQYSPREPNTNNIDFAQYSRPSQAERNVPSHYDQIDQPHHHYSSLADAVDNTPPMYQQTDVAQLGMPNTYH